jgi:hypothetical protein
MTLARGCAGKKKTAGAPAAVSPQRVNRAARDGSDAPDQGKRQ